jgi:hypothetical protein
MKKTWKFKLNLTDRAEQVRRMIGEFDSATLENDIMIVRTTDDAFQLRMKLDHSIESIEAA